MRHLSLPNKQDGWLMPMAVFIIVVMALFAATMNRIGSQSAISVVQEQLSLQAFYVAESGAQLALNQLLYPTPSLSRIGLDCDDGDPEPHAITRHLGAPGMQGCSVGVDFYLQCPSADSVEPIVVRVESSGSCARGGISAERNLEVGTWVD